MGLHYKYTNNFKLNKKRLCFFTVLAVSLQYELAR